jgi:V8-like Glu-specific endopeptidase
VVLTAAHCLYDSTSPGGWATEVVVVPGRNGAAEPYGFQTATDLRVPGQYVSSGAPAFDFGLVLLPNSQLSNQTGRFRYAGSAGDALVGRTANLSGYPGEDYTRQWFHAGPIADRSYTAGSDTGLISYPMDTTGGQSGSPMWLSDGTNRVIIGVHTRGDASVFCSNTGGANNCGTLITNMVAGQLEAGGADARSALPGTSIAEQLPGSQPPPTVPPTASIPTGGIGGRGLAIEPGPGRNVLTWQDGAVETGYLVGRFNGSALTVLPPGGPLGANTTSYTDASAPAGLSCYLVAALGGTTGGALGVSDLLCGAYGVRSASRAPDRFKLSLNQSSIANLSWVAPAGGGFDSYVLVPLGKTPIVLAANATTASVPVSGPTCLLLFTMQAGAPVGNSDAVCGVPGVNTLP